MNAVCKRVIGTPCRELLDRTLVLNDRRLALLLHAFLIHCNGHRPHQSWQQRPPDIAAKPAPHMTALNDLRSIRRKPVVTGTLNECHHAA